ncbi:MAG: dihydroorotate dehydrogenase (quinone), partial [Chitinophagaceae bacterium]|nr:dihydroorotate dehydrogenase (quinone) [Chitinophagaceae bacterium]
QAMASAAYVKDPEPSDPDLKKVYRYADYITINISSPNTPQLRQLQQGEYLNRLLLAVSDIRSILEKEQGVYKPILLKISPDETPETLAAIADAVLRHKMDGIIATNTTVDKSKVTPLLHSNESGGLSGAPLLQDSNHTLQALHNLLGDKSTLIGVGGIMKAADVKTKFLAGAQLIQIYTGFIYNGPFWLRRLIKAI